MGMIRRGRKRLGATRDSLRSQVGVGKETLGGCRESHGETPRDERLFEVTEVGADVRFVERDGLHRRCRHVRRWRARGRSSNVLQVGVWPILFSKVENKTPLKISQKLMSTTIVGIMGPTKGVA